jgi:hypothetical protein
MTGKTMRKAEKTGVFSAPKKRKAIRITDITGVADITEKSGFKKSPALLSRAAASPQKSPRGRDMAIPPRTLKKVEKREERNLGLPAMPARERKTGSGPGNTRALPKSRETASQKIRIAAIPAKTQGNETPFRLLPVINQPRLRADGVWLFS